MPDSFSRQEKIRTRKRRRLIAYALCLLTVLTALVAGSAYFSFSPFMTVSYVEANGGSEDHDAYIKSWIEEKISKNKLIMFSGKNTFLLSTIGMERAISKDTTWIRDIDISRAGLTSLVADYSEKDEVALWCGGDERCIYLDSEGYAFDEADTASSSLFIFERQFDGDPLGTHLLPEDDFASYIFFIQQLRSLGVYPVKLRFERGTDAVIMLSEGGHMLIDLKDDLGKALNSVRSVLLSEPEGLEAKEFLAKIDYIDFRYGQKIVYKLKGALPADL